MAIVYRMRFVNYLLLCTFAGLLVWLLQRERFPFSVPLACAVIAIPTVWVCAGVALDEMLGLVFLTLGFIPISKACFDSSMPAWNRALRFLFAGIAIGLASLVRQPFVVASGAIPIAAIVHRRNVASALLTPAAAILILAPAVVIWRGLTPPLVGDHAGLSIEHGAISLAYGGLFSFVIAPRFFRFRKWQILAAMLFSVVGLFEIGIS